jgi:hypothetical protein
MMKELKRHGYRVSPGTLYPLLHVLQRNRLYRATKKGREALNFAKDKVREVFGGTDRGTLMRRRPTVNCRPSDTPAGNPLARNLPNHDSARVGKGTDRATSTVHHGSL